MTNPTIKQNAERPLRSHPIVSIGTGGIGGPQTQVLVEPIFIELGLA